MSKPSIRKQIANALERPILWASGADLEILASVPTEKSKYFGIGGTILFTAMMASLAGGYAFFTAFKDPTLSIFFGVFWGGLIFNLDRYIVSTFGVGDGKRTISKQELIEGAPRIIMAIVLGIVIATPLELKLFEAEINSEIESIQANRRNELENQITGSTNALVEGYKEQKAQIESNQIRREAEKQAKYDEYERANTAQLDELYGRGPSGRPGRGRTWRNLNDIAEGLLQEHQTLMNAHRNAMVTEAQTKSNLDSLISDYEKSKEIELKRALSVIETYDGFLARLEALDSLTQNKPHLGTARLLISLLFILIEIAPILFKMMTERGPYDDIIERVKHDVKVRQMLEQSNINQEVNHQVKISADRLEQQMIAESLANKELLTSIAQAQREIASAAIEAWKIEQMEKAKSKSDNFITPHT